MKDKDNTWLLWAILLCVVFVSLWDGKELKRVNAKLDRIEQKQCAEVEAMK